MHVRTTPCMYSKVHQTDHSTKPLSSRVCKAHARQHFVAETFCYIQLPIKKQKKSASRVTIRTGDCSPATCLTKSQDGSLRTHDSNACLLFALDSLRSQFARCLGSLFHFLGDLEPCREVDVNRVPGHPRHLFRSRFRDFLTSDSDVLTSQRSRRKPAPASPMC
jgi:hypothetical protein